MFFNKNTETSSKEKLTGLRLEIYLKDFHSKRQNCLIYLTNGECYEGILSTVGIDFISLCINVKQNNTVKRKHIFIPLAAVVTIEPLE